MLGLRVLLGVKVDCVIWFNGLAGRRLLRGKVGWLARDGLPGMVSKSIVALGVISSSEFSDIV